MTTNTTLQATALKALRDDAVTVSVFLKNGIKLQGQIGQVDQYSLLLHGDTDTVVYKHAISTIMPADNSARPRQHPA